MCTRTPVTGLGMYGNGDRATYLKVPAEPAMSLDDRLSSDAGAALGCGPGTARACRERLGDLGGATFAVFGLGPVGLSAVMLATALGAKVIAVDLVEARRDHARRLGAAEVVDPQEVDPASTIRDLTDGAGVDALLESS